MPTQQYKALWRPNYRKKRGAWEGSLILSINQLPEEAQVEMDFLPIGDHVLYKSGSLIDRLNTTTFLIHPQCLKKCHNGGRGGGDCGCFVLYEGQTIHETIWKPIPGIKHWRAK